jgi:GT2 family glycosyltransferase
MQRNHPHVTAIIVTFNRKALLTECLAALTAQERQPDHVLVVDNASTDGTAAMLVNWVWRGTGTFESRTLAGNAGGAGGFAEGMRVAVDSDTDWMWMMDDDAEPHPDALAKLMQVASNTENVYGSVATHGKATSWTTTLCGLPRRVVTMVAEVPTSAEVESLPFLGFLIHRNLVKRVGLPDAGYFIAADDIEYCLRLRRASAKIMIVGGSHIEHPKSVANSIRLFGLTIIYLSLAPWKRYYDTRNRILNARKYAPLQLFTHVMPGTFVRLCSAMRREPDKLAQCRAFAGGTIDGLLGRKGRRHDAWGIKQ